MNKIFYIAGLSTFLISTVTGFLVIPLLKKIKAGQPILEYVKEHKDKDGTPTMGGLFFVASAIAGFIIFGGLKSHTATVAVTISFAFTVVGFLDDFLKIKLKKNEGLKAYQKIIFQAVVSVSAGIFAYKNGITKAYIPFFSRTLDFGVFSIPLIIFIFLAITNSVNLTDGLDGLCGSVSVVYLFFLCFLIVLERKSRPELYITNDYEKIILSCACFIGAIAGFLVFNVNRAKVFMGDTGSLALGGFIGAVSIFSLNALLIPVLGAMYVFSSLSVIIQVLHFKRTKKRVFLMSPFHHHLQLKGLSESKIAYIYSLFTCIIGVMSVIFYL